MAFNIKKLVEEKNSHDNKGIKALKNYLSGDKFEDDLQKVMEVAIQCERSAWIGLYILKQPDSNLTLYLKMSYDVTLVKDLSLQQLGNIKNYVDQIEQRLKELQDKIKSEGTGYNIIYKIAGYDHIDIEKLNTNDLAEVVIYLGLKEINNIK